MSIKCIKRDDTEHGVDYYRASEVDAMLAEQPAQCKPLTEKEIWAAIRPLTTSDEVCTALIKVSMAEYRAIEAAHSITKENT